MRACYLLMTLLSIVPLYSMEIGKEQLSNEEILINYIRERRAYAIDSPNYDTEEAHYHRPVQKKASIGKNFIINGGNAIMKNPCCFYFAVFLTSGISGGIAAGVGLMVLEYLQS